MRNAIRRKLHVSLSERDQSARNMDALELLSAVRLQVLQKLCDPDAMTGIDSIEAYAAKAAYNACSDLLRSRFPQRARLANMLRRTFDKSDRFGLLYGSSPEPTVALSGWSTNLAVAPAAQVIQLRLEPAHFLPARLARKPLDRISRSDLCALIEAVLDYLQAPVRFDDLVGIAAAFLQVEDSPDEELPDEGVQTPAFSGAARTPGGFSLWLATERVRLLWDALSQILPWHRAAFLLNLRNGDIGAFPYYGIASVRQIGESLGLSAKQYFILAEALQLPDSIRGQLQSLTAPGQKFAIFWNYLPLEDNVIAAVLGVQRPQVIAYRNKALERLRRMLTPVL